MTKMHNMQSKEVLVHKIVYLALRPRFLGSGVAKEAYRRLLSHPRVHPRRCPRRRRRRRGGGGGGGGGLGAPAASLFLGGQYALGPFRVVE